MPRNNKRTRRKPSWFEAKLIGRTRDIQDVLKGGTMKKECKHFWEIYSAYKECVHCGQIIQSLKS